MGDSDNELIIYVLQQLRQGVPEATIRGVLAQNGWPQQLIDRAFSMVQQAAPHDLTPKSYDKITPLRPTLAQPALPTPNEKPYLRPDASQPSTLTPEPGKGRRRIFVVSLAILLLATAGLLALFVNDKEASAPNGKPQQQSKTNPDTQRRNHVNALSGELTAYYRAKGTYPTLAQLNAPAFATAEEGFDITTFRNPSWKDSSTCTDKEKRPIFTDVRAEDCYIYRATALNGGDCDGAAARCTRFVLSAILEGGKPYIIAFDQNKKEKIE